MQGSALAAAFVAAALVAESTSPAASQPQRPVFRTGVNYVEVDANVSDSKGEFVTGLTKDDFTVVEDGKVQTVSVFSTVDIPVEIQSPPAEKPAQLAAADTAINQPFKGRVYALLLDEQQTTPAGTRRVREAARSFVTRFVGDGDLVAVAGTLGTAAQVLTTDRARVLRAIDRFMGLQGQTMAAAGEADQIINLGLPAKVADAAVNVYAEGQLRERRSNGRITLGTIEALADYLGRIPDRRKAMVMIGGGLRDVTDDRDLQEDLHHAIQAANRANVAIYGVDVRGLPEAGTPAEMGASGSSSLLSEFQSGQEGTSVSRQRRADSRRQTPTILLPACPAS
jgi:VWFA-related protein